MMLFAGCVLIGAIVASAYPVFEKAFSLAITAWHYRAEGAAAYISAGRYPKPVKVGPGSSRWLRSEVEACLKAMVEGRR
jgi:predicted DNA-binding transcriptional regulator AlpA